MDRTAERAGTARLQIAASNRWDLSTKRATWTAWRHWASMSRRGAYEKARREGGLFDLLVVDELDAVGGIPVHRFQTSNPVMNIGLFGCSFSPVS